MKKLSLILLVFTVFACNPNTKQTTENQIQSETTESVYDSVLVKKFGADEFGMKKYVIAFLKRGPNRSKDSLEAVNLQKEHLKNINRLAEEGILILAGPFFGDGNLRGIYVFDVQSIEEAKKLTETDPLIQSGGLIMELHEWYGSAALIAIPEIHKKLEKINIAE